MNILIDNFPTEIYGIPIDTDYRRIVQFELLMLDKEIPPIDKIALAIDLIYLKPVPDLFHAWDGLLWYYSGGYEKGAKKTRANNRRVYDFEEDAERIYTAFLQEYQIDLQERAIHWWKFRALLFALPDTCFMGKIMYYRGLDLSQLKGVEKKHALKMQNMFAIEKRQTMTKAQREAEYLLKIEQRRKQLEAQLKEGE